MQGESFQTPGVITLRRLVLSQDFLGGYQPALLVLLLFPAASAVAVRSAHPAGDPESPAADPASIA